MKLIYVWFILLKIVFNFVSTVYDMSNAICDNQNCAHV